MKNKDNLEAAGFLIHRLADTFAHRQLDNPSLLYERDIGHALDLHAPDVIQQNPDLYNQYLQTLISTLAQVNPDCSS